MHVSFRYHMLTLMAHFCYVQVKDSEAGVLSSLSISETPALVVLTPEGETVKYEGETLSK